MHIELAEVALEDVDQTVIGVGRVLDPAQCAVSDRGEREACVVVAVNQTNLGAIHPGTPARARASEFLQKTFPGRVGWIAGALDPTGRTANVECLVADAMGELVPGRDIRVEIAVGTHKAFAVPRGAVVRRASGDFVFVLLGTSPDGRDRFVAVPVRVEEDTGGEWIPVGDVQPGTRVVTHSADALASMVKTVPL